MSQVLRAPLEIGFDYTRSTGPTLSRFLAGLAGGRILGARGADGRVHVPPFEFDPVTFAPPAGFVEVGLEGTVLTWTWLSRPRAGQPLGRPFGWALIRLDGADTGLLHAVDAGSAAAMRTGMRVRVRWAASRTGDIRDIECFEPCDGPPAERAAAGDGEPVAMITTPIERRRARSCTGWRRAGCWASGARRAASSTCRRARPARWTGCRPPPRWRSPTPGR